MSDSSMHKEFIPHAIEFVKSPKAKNVATGEGVTNKLRCIKRFQITLKSLLLLWDELQQTHALKFCLQDILTKTCLRMSLDLSGSNEGIPTVRPLFSSPGHSGSYF